MAIADGELLVLLGPSGCGKSTTLNMIAGLTAPTSGRDHVRWRGRDRRCRRISATSRWCFQSSLLYPHLTARQNIAMSLKRQPACQGGTRRPCRGGRRIVDVTALLDKLPSELSAASGSASRPPRRSCASRRRFLLDEPLAASMRRCGCRSASELVNLQKRLGTTMVFVTHDQIEAMTMGDRIAVMREGQLEQIGTPKEIYNRPATFSSPVSLARPR